MGSRGAFIDVDSGDFTFTENGQKYMAVGMIDNVKVLVQTSGSVKALEYSHTANRIYAIVQKGQLKHIAFYDENHKQIKAIDLMHKHNGIIPHYHLNMKHGKDEAYAISDEDKIFVSKIKKGLNSIR